MHNYTLFTSTNSLEAIEELVTIPERKDRFLPHPVYCALRHTKVYKKFVTYDVITTKICYSG